MSLSPAEVLERLDPEQRTAVEATRGPVCILAGAGTGKTRTITHRIAYSVLTGAAPATQILAVTFTARAAGELRDRLRGLSVEGVQARTFHAAALRQLQYFWPRSVGGAMPPILENKFAVVSAAAQKVGLRPGKTEVRDLLAEIEWAKTTLTVPEGYAAATSKADREPPFAADQVAAVYSAYEDAKRRREVVDFEDLLLLTAAAIEQHRDVAEEVRARYRHFVVDEYQDVSPLQQRLLDAWLGGRDDLCVVGDPNQTIYSFTGATPDHLLDFGRRFPGAAVVRLVRDYRSTPQVVELANRVIASAAPGSAPALRLEAQRPPGPAPDFASYDDEANEARAVATRCAALITGGVRPSEIAILYRVNAQSEAFETALADAGVAYQVRGGARFFDRPEVREAVLLLRGAARGGDPDVAIAAAVEEVLGTSGWNPTPPAGGAARDRWESLEALRRLADDLVTAGTVTDLTGFVAELERRQAAAHAPTVEAVTLASLHAAKGLEWDAVFLVGLVEGSVPYVRATSPEQVEEERRLLYVGVTRAREHLSLTWARSRTGGRGSRRPSRFLDGILPSSLAATAPAGKRADGSRSRSSRRGPVTCRVCARPLFETVERKLGRCAGCAGDVDEAMFDRLREWRSALAKEQKVPAYVVFTDATLTAIAEAKPTTVAELVAVPGVGQRKLDSYGDAVLALVAEKPAQ